MAPAAPMQRKAIGRAVIAVLAVGPTRGTAVAVQSLLHRLLRLAAGDERRQPVDILFVGRLKVLLPRLIMLRLLVRLLLLMRLLLLLARIERLLLARSKRLAAGRWLVVVAVVERIVGRIAAHVAGLLLLLVISRLALPQVLLRRRDQAEIVLGVLVVVFGGDGIARALRITGKLEIFFGDVRGIASDFHVRPVGLVHAR